jgi:hypothetical protein
LKKKLRKKSALGSSLTKAIPLSVAIALLSSGTVFGSEQNRWLAVEFPELGVRKFEISRLDDPVFRARVIEALRRAWVNAEHIYVGLESESNFTDFSGRAMFGDSFSEALARGATIDGATIDIIY